MLVLFCQTLHHHPLTTAPSTTTTTTSSDNAGEAAARRAPAHEMIDIQTVRRCVAVLKVHVMLDILVHGVHERSSRCRAGCKHLARSGRHVASMLLLLLLMVMMMLVLMMMMMMLLLLTLVMSVADLREHRHGNARPAL